MSPRVAVHEDFHFLGISGQDDGQLPFVLRDLLEEDLDHLPAVIAGIVVPALQGVGLVDEQHAAQGLLDQGLGPGSGLADVLADQVGAVGLDQVPAWQQPDALEDTAQLLGDDGFPGPGIAGEDRVQVDPVRLLEPLLLPQLDELHVLNEIGYPGFDRVQADQGIQSVQDILGARGFFLRWPERLRVLGEDERKPFVGIDAFLILFAVRGGGDRKFHIGQQQVHKMHLDAIVPFLPAAGFISAPAQDDTELRFVSADEKQLADPAFQPHGGAEQADEDLAGPIMRLIHQPVLRLQLQPDEARLVTGELIRIVPGIRFQYQGRAFK